MNKVTLITADVLAGLDMLPDGSVQCVVTSPPYWGLRDYGVAGQIGIEPTIEEYVVKMVEVFSEVRRVLRSDGVCFINLGDSYMANCSNQNPSTKQHIGAGHCEPNRTPQINLKPKDLCGIPWRVALALQADGWWLRSEITWCKKAPMPESVTDRPANATEKIFMLTKSPRYFYDAVAVREPSGANEASRKRAEYGRYDAANGEAKRNTRTGKPDYLQVPGNHEGNGSRNLWNYWILGPAPFKDAHFATFVPELVRRAVAAGTSEYGCCPSCKSPWERVVEKTFIPQGDVSLAKGIKGAGNQKPMDASSSWDGVPRGSTHATTTGWAPGCDCPNMKDEFTCIDPIPCTVLDPFGGASTTGLVAAKMGRDTILIELNPEYVEMSRKRIVGDMGMLCEVKVIQ